MPTPGTATGEFQTDDSDVFGIDVIVAGWASPLDETTVPGAYA